MGCVQHRILRMRRGTSTVDVGGLSAGHSLNVKAGDEAEERACDVGIRSGGRSIKSVPQQERLEPDHRLDLVRRPTAFRNSSGRTSARGDGTPGSTPTKTFAAVAATDRMNPCLASRPFKAGVNASRLRGRSVAETAISAGAEPASECAIRFAWAWSDRPALTAAHLPSGVTSEARARRTLAEADAKPKIGTANWCRSIDKDG
jgi:hypothetical protein